MNRKASGWLGKRGEGYVFIQFILFGLIGFAPRLLPGALLPASLAPVGQVAGILIALVGLGLAFAGVFSLGDNLAAVPHPKEGSQLVAHGAYQIVRHPIYSGIIFAAFGWSLMTNSWAAAAFSSLLALFFDIKSRREEGWLAEKFADYPAYQQQVKKLIPFIY